jgi:uncharacterized Zn-binding protein involved in type VI secretion
MAQQVCRVGDVGISVAPCSCHTIPQHYTTVIIAGSPVTTVDGLNCATISSVGAASCGHATVAITGSSVSDSQGLGLHRVGDMGRNCGTYVMVSGSPNVDSL